MKVLVLPSWYSNSYNPIAGVFFRDQSIMLAEAGMDVKVLSINAFSIKDFFRYGKLPRECREPLSSKITLWQVNILNIPKLHAVNFTIRALIAVKKYWENVRIWHPDLIIAHSYRAGVNARIISKFFNVPYILMEHSSKLYHHLSKTEDWLSNWAFKGAKKVAAVSKPFADYLSKMTGLDFLVIPNVVDVTGFVPEKASDVDEFTILQVGAFRVGKGTAILIEAFSKFLKSNCKAKLVLVGEGSEKTQIVKSREFKACYDNVDLLGRLPKEKMIDVYKRSSVLVVTSDIETFSVVVIEALSMGVPVISTRCGGPEWILSGVPHCTIVGRSPDEVCNALQIAFDNPKAPFEELHSLVASKFSKDSVLKIILPIITSVVPIKKNITWGK